MAISRALQQMPPKQDKEAVTTKSQHGFHLNSVCTEIERFLFVGIWHLPK